MQEEARDTDKEIQRNRFVRLLFLIWCDKMTYNSDDKKE